MDFVLKPCLLDVVKRGTAFKNVLQILNAVFKLVCDIFQRFGWIWLCSGAQERCPLVALVRGNRQLITYAEFKSRLVKGQDFCFSVKYLTSYR